MGAGSTGSHSEASSKSGLQGEARMPSETPCRQMEESTLQLPNLLPVEGGLAGAQEEDAPGADDRLRPAPQDSSLEHADPPSP